MTAPDQSPRWRSLIGVYDADGGLLGELAYVGGRLLGVVNCALCAITHGPAREKPSFRMARERLGLPFATLHRNEQPPALRALTEGRTPCVVGETASGYRILLERGQLEACRGDVGRLEDALREALGGP